MLGGQQLPKGEDFFKLGLLLSTGRALWSEFENRIGGIRTPPPPPPPTPVPESLSPQRSMPCTQDTNPSDEIPKDDIDKIIETAIDYLRARDPLSALLNLSFRKPWKEDSKGVNSIQLAIRAIAFLELERYQEAVQVAAEAIKASYGYGVVTPSCEDEFDSDSEDDDSEFYETAGPCWARIVLSVIYQRCGYVEKASCAKSAAGGNGESWSTFEMRGLECLGDKNMRIYMNIQHTEGVPRLDTTRPAKLNLKLPPLVSKRKQALRNLLIQRGFLNQQGQLVNTNVDNNIGIDNKFGSA